MAENSGRLDKGDDSSYQIEMFLSGIQNEKVHLFPHIELQRITSNFTNEIGSGEFGKVYRGFAYGKEVAVKVLRDNTSDDMTNKFMASQFLDEVAIMSRTYHQNLVKLYGFCLEDNTKALVYEYVENESFDKILYQNESSVEWVKLFDIAVKIARGLSYLHESCSPPIIHHDIKADNVLLDSNHSPKIADFGLAKLGNSDLSDVSKSRFRGTYGYAAPEVCFGWNDITSYKCDVYSYGMMLFEVLRRKRIWEGQEWFPFQVWKTVKNGILDEMITGCGILAKDDKDKAKRLSLVALMCAQDIPQLRPLMSTVVMMLDGEIEPSLPLDPFPFYDLSSESSTMRKIGGRTVPVKLSYSQVSSIIASSIAESNARIQEKLPSPVPNGRATPSDTLLETFQKLCPPGGDDSVILYTTSRGNKEPYKNSTEVRSILKSHMIHMYERDIYGPGYKKELKTLTGNTKVPVLFVRGRLIGGAAEVMKMDSEGKLEILFEDMPKVYDMRG